MFGKPLQPLAPGVSILSQLIGALQRSPCIDEVALAIAEGVENEIFIEVAEMFDCQHLVGSENDVLERVFDLASRVGATDVFRKTSEDPFFDYALLPSAWQQHVDEQPDATVVDNLPEGTGFEIVSMSALSTCYEFATGSEREHILDYLRSHRSKFHIKRLEPAIPCRRPDLRLTVDNPEDLIVARAVYQRFARSAPLIPLADIVAFLDANQDLTAVNKAFVSNELLWQE